MTMKKTIQELSDMIAAATKRADEESGGEFSRSRQERNKKRLHKYVEWRNYISASTVQENISAIEALLSPALSHSMDSTERAFLGSLLRDARNLFSTQN